ncbi:MAG: hypothetical protein M1838_005910 [Thelocarpon superellum]|nr:MAG: hypothetical protein M1838_005910 [Thelocarpon superellum]
MSYLDTFQTLVATFFLGVLFHYAFTTKFVLMRGCSSSLLQDRPRLVLVLVVFLASLWAKLTFVNFAMPSRVPCQVTTVLATLVDQLARTIVDGALLAISGQTVTSHSLRSAGPILLLARSVAGIVLTAYTRPQLVPICMAYASAVPSSAIVIGLDLLVILAVLRNILSENIWAHARELSSSVRKEQCKAVVFLLAGNAIWFATSIPSILPAAAIPLFFRIALPCVGLYLLIQILDLYQGALLRPSEFPPPNSPHSDGSSAERERGLHGTMRVSDVSEADFVKPEPNGPLNANRYSGARSVLPAADRNWPSRDLRGASTGTPQPRRPTPPAKDFPVIMDARFSRLPVIHEQDPNPPYLPTNLPPFDPSAARSRSVATSSMGRKSQNFSRPVMPVAPAVAVTLSAPPPTLPSPCHPVRTDPRNARPAYSTSRGHLRPERDSQSSPTVKSPLPIILSPLPPPAPLDATKATRAPPRVAGFSPTARNESETCPVALSANQSAFQALSPPQLSQDSGRKSDLVDRLLSQDVDNMSLDGLWKNRVESFGGTEMMRVCLVEDLSHQSPLQVRSVVRTSATPSIPRKPVPAPRTPGGHSLSSTRSTSPPTSVGPPTGSDRSEGSRPFAASPDTPASGNVSVASDGVSATSMYSRSMSQWSQPARESRAVKPRPIHPPSPLEQMLSRAESMMTRSRFSTRSTAERAIFPRQELPEPLPFTRSWATRTASPLSATTDTGSKTVPFVLAPAVVPARQTLRVPRETPAGSAGTHGPEMPRSHFSVCSPEYQSTEASQPFSPSGHPPPTPPRHSPADGELEMSPMLEHPPITSPEVAPTLPPTPTSSISVEFGDKATTSDHGSMTARSSPSPRSARKESITMMLDLNDLQLTLTGVGDETSPLLDLAQFSGAESIQRPWHRRVGENPPTFSRRMHQRRSRALSVPTPLYLLPFNKRRSMPTMPTMPTIPAMPAMPTKESESESEPESIQLPKTETSGAVDPPASSPVPPLVVPSGDRRPPPLILKIHIPAGKMLDQTALPAPEISMSPATISGKPESNAISHAATQDPAHLGLWKPRPAPAATMKRAHTVLGAPSSGFPRSRRSKPMSRVHDDAMRIQSSKLWQKTNTSHIPVHPGLWGSKPPVPPKNPPPVGKPRPKRKSKRRTNLFDIIENPEPLPGQREGLGVFNAPWGPSESTIPHFLFSPPEKRALRSPRPSADGNGDEPFVKDDDFDESTIWEIASLLNARDDYTPSGTPITGPMR